MAIDPNTQRQALEERYRNLELRRLGLETRKARLGPDFPATDEAELLRVCQDLRQVMRELETLLPSDGSYHNTNIPGLPPALRNRLKTTLLRCGPFSSHRALKAVFVDARIAEWRNDIPEAHSRAERVKAVIDFLYDRRDRSGQNGLVLFLRVLCDDVGTGDACHNDLVRLANELESALKGHSSATSPSGPLESDDGFKDLNIPNGLDRMRARLEEEVPRESKAYLDFIDLRDQMLRNLKATRVLGGSGELRGECNRISRALNRLALKYLEEPFTDLCLE